MKKLKYFVSCCFMVFSLAFLQSSQIQQNSNSEMLGGILLYQGYSLQGEGNNIPAQVSFAAGYTSITVGTGIVSYMASGSWAAAVVGTFIASNPIGWGIGLAAGAVL